MPPHLDPPEPPQQLLEERQTQHMLENKLQFLHPRPFLHQSTMQLKESFA